MPFRGQIIILATKLILGFLAGVASFLKYFYSRALSNKAVN